MSCFLSALYEPTKTVQYEQQQQARPGPLHPHAVILHRDEYHLNRLDDVVQIVVKVVGALSSLQAKGIVAAAFTVGQEIVIICPKETAEHYQERLSASGLTVTVEAR